MTVFPDIIESLPEADLPFEGVKAYLVQGPNQQMVFMSFDFDLEVPEHSHDAQWGIVLDGEIELVISGRASTFGKGDTYFIPKGVPHSAKIRAGYKDLTLFNQRDRYQLKKDI